MNGEKLTAGETPGPENTHPERLPIFFFQAGNNISLFYDKVLEQAALTNGRENIFVLADANFHLYKDYNCIDISKYRNSTAEFDKVYQHHSTNKFAYEKACFDRWFIIKAVAGDLGFDHFFHADFDVVILEDLKPVYDQYIKSGVDGSITYTENEQGNSITVGHSSFWNTKLITDFCNFVCQRFADKPALDALLKETATGKFYQNYNLSDMILLDVFRTETQPAIFNLLKLQDDNISFDLNLNEADNGGKYRYRMHPVYKIKKLLRRKDGLYGQLAADASTYRKFYTLHFQGFLTKTLIPLHINAQGFNENLVNRWVSAINFSVRKTRLLKNQWRDRIRKLTGKK